MEKEKKIEELAEAIYKSGVAIEGTDIAFGLYDTDTHFHRMAAKLYDAGYGNVKEAVKEFAERVKKRIEIDKYTPEITKDYDEEDKNNCEYYNLGLNHAQIIIDFFVKEVRGE